MNFADAPTAESPALKTTEMRSPKMPPPRADQTAEVPIDDLGLHLDHLEETGCALADQHLAARGDRSSGRCADHGGGPRRAVAAHDGGSGQPTRATRDLTELERELEASFIAELEHPAG